MNTELFKKDLESLFNEWVSAYEASKESSSADYCLGHVDALYSAQHLLEKHLTKENKKQVIVYAYMLEIYTTDGKMNTHLLDLSGAYYEEPRDVAPKYYSVENFPSHERIGYKKSFAIPEWKFNSFIGVYAKNGCDATWYKESEVERIGFSRTYRSKSFTVGELFEQLPQDQLIEYIKDNNLKGFENK